MVLHLLHLLLFLFNGLMAIPNFIALFALSGKVAQLTKDYFAEHGTKAKSKHK